MVGILALENATTALVFKCSFLYRLDKRSPHPSSTVCLKKTTNLACKQNFPFPPVGERQHRSGRDHKAGKCGRGIRHTSVILHEFNLCIRSVVDTSQESESSFGVCREEAVHHEKKKAQAGLMYYSYIIVGDVLPGDVLPAVCATFLGVDQG